MAEIALRGVDATRLVEGGRAVALAGVDLTVPAHALLVLTGTTGAGKSSLLRVVAGLLVPERGAVVIDGRDVTNRPVHERDIVLVSGDSPLPVRRTVRRVLHDALRYGDLGHADVSSRVDVEARAFGIMPLLDRSIGTLAAGDRQVVRIARAMLRRPRACLLDEPLVGLDPWQRSVVLARIRRLRADGVTTLVAARDSADLMEVADLLAVLDAGRIVQVDDPSTCRARPATMLVAESVCGADLQFVVAAAVDSTLDLGGQRLPQPSSARTSMVDGDPVVLGVPAQALSMEGLGPPLVCGVLQATGVGPFRTVDVVIEPAGGGASRLRASLPAAPEVQPGSGLVLHVDLARCCLFDRRTGFAIWHGPSR